MSQKGVQDNFNHTKGVQDNFNRTDRKIMRNLHEMIIRNTANYSLNLPICVCSSRKFDKKNGKICKNHEEKHKIDVKENEKTCGQHAKNLERRQKTGFFSGPNRGWAKMGTTPF